MDQTGKTFTSEGADARQWTGRIIMAVILGEAVWSLIVSVMNNLVVPWLGDAMGQSSGLPTSFTQRPYDYPDLFVSVVEACIAVIVAVSLNYFFQRPRAERVKPVKSPVLVVPVDSSRLIPQAWTPAAPPVPVVKPDPVFPGVPVTVAATPQASSVVPSSVAKPVAVAPPAPPVVNSAAKPLPPTPVAEPPKPKKPKDVYYNIVGEPMPSDED